MLSSKLGRFFLIVFLLANVALLGLLAFGVTKQPGLLGGILPGKFGASASPDLSGNMLYLAILLAVDAGLFLIFGVGGSAHALLSGLRISPVKMRWFLNERVGLAKDISGVVASAVQEEEKAELSYLGTARLLLGVGLLLTLAALPALCIAYTHAAPNGTAVFTDGTAPISNSAIGNDTALRFTADQAAGALLLDAPEIFHWRATPTEINRNDILLSVLLFLYRGLLGAGTLLWIVGMRRASSLRAFAMEVAMPVADVVAMEPVLQEGHGHGHDDHGHGGHDAHGHDDHRHGHEEKAHDDHGHGGHDNHGRDDHGHGGHEEEAHDDHGHGGHDEEAHDDQGHGGHDNHGHDDHGHGGHGDHGHGGHDDHGKHHHAKAA